MKIALITGATRGIGEAILKKFSQSYTCIFFYQKSKDKADYLQKAYNARAYRLDISSYDSVKDSIADILNTYKHIDVLVNNAGICQYKLFDSIDINEWKIMIDTNLSSVFYTCKEVAPSMITRKQGSIINISSVWGFKGSACEAHYSASKAGIIGFSNSLAKELGPSGIRVNCIAPGVIETDMLSSFSQEEKLDLLNSTPLLRLGKADDVANLAYFLASQEASFITGQCIAVDGGFSIN